jgi:FtsZ-interacting cell division protein ZipA
MNTTKKIAIGIGVASGALLAAWLLTGSRKEKTKEFFAKKTSDLKNSLKKDENGKVEESESYYI